MKEKTLNHKKTKGVFMKHKNKLNLILVALGLVFFVSGSIAQNFTNNTGGTYTAAACGAVIKMKSTSATFNGSAQLGTGTGNRIQGIVDWAATTNGQTVQGLYYTNLVVSGAGTKNIADGIYVSGEGCPSPLPGYAAITGGVGYYATGGNRTYSGTFHYDGSVAQVVFGEAGGTAGTNRYYNLDLIGGGTKTNNDPVIVDNSLTTASGTALTVADDFTVYGTGTSTIDGGVNINGDDGTSFTFAGSGATVNVNSNITATVGALDINNAGGQFNILSGGSLTIATGTATTGGRLVLGANTYLDLASSFTNNDANHDNMIFDVTSTVAYTQTSGNQNIVFTNDSDPQHNYGLLVFSGGAQKDATGDVHTRGNVTVAGGPVVMGIACASGNTFFANAVGGNKITYSSANNDEYIRGNVTYRGTFTTGTEYTFNNAQTRVAFNTAPNGTNPYFSLNVQPNTAPENTADFNTQYDLNRCVTIDYSGTAGIISTLRVGYTSADIGGGFIGSESNLRFEEAWSDVAGDRHKVTGGAGLATNSGGTNPRFVQLVTDPTKGLLLDGTANGGTTYSISQNSSIVLTAAPLQFIAITNGRWTNPTTWDEGVVPGSNDNTLIRALVYAGIDGPAYGTPAANNTTSERDHYGVPLSQNEIQIAHSITIDNGNNYALIIGNEDNNDNAILTTAMTGTVGGIAAGFYNNNPLVNSPSNDSWNNKATDPTGSNVNGLFISNIKNTGYSNVPIFGAGQITNAGTIVNYSIIELGQ